MNTCVGRDKRILIQNYHPSATAGLIRDFKGVGFDVVAPNRDWVASLSGMNLGSNENLGARLISFDEYRRLRPGFVLVTCKPHEHILLDIGRSIGDEMIYHVAQQGQVYLEEHIRIMLCPDIVTYREYPYGVDHKILYLMRPEMTVIEKDFVAAFENRSVNSYISIPHVWTKGYPTYLEFKSKFGGECRMFGHESPDGHLEHQECGLTMSKSFLTVHFKDQEAYGLSCVESMMQQTPIVSIKSLMSNKTLGEIILNDSNSIMLDSVDELISRIDNLSLTDYVELCLAAKYTITDLTSPKNNTAPLRAALWSAYGL